MIIILRVLIMMITVITFLVVIGCNNGDENLSLGFQLNQHEKNVYEALQHNLDESLLKGLSPISIAKIYVYSNFDAEHDVTYLLYTQRNGHIAWTKEEHLQIPEKDRGTKEQILEMFKGLEHGRFIQVSDDEGYIEYEVKPGQKSGFQMIQDETGIWKVAFMPIQ